MGVGRDALEERLGLVGRHGGTGGERTRRVRGSPSRSHRSLRRECCVAEDDFTLCASPKGGSPSARVNVSMIRRFLAATAAVALSATGLLAACSGANSHLGAAPDASVAAGSCVPGQQIGCACRAAPPARKICCRPKGTGYGSCLGCTLPDGAPVGPGASPAQTTPRRSSSPARGPTAARSSPSPAPTAAPPRSAARSTIPRARTPSTASPSTSPPDSPPAFPQCRATCSCDGLYPLHPVTVAQTDAAGRFTLQNVPSQSSVPLVLQVGKWRTQLTPAITPCQANALPDKSLTLPKNHSVGDIPQIAISTGSADSLECLLLRVGLDPAEYVGGAGGPNHIHIFQGGGTTALDGVAPNTTPPGPASSTGLWASQADLMAYDMVFLSCEGAETASMNQTALFDYAAAGGRVFLRRTFTARLVQTRRPVCRRQHGDMNDLDERPREHQRQRRDHASGRGGVHQGAGALLLDERPRHPRRRPAPHPASPREGRLRRPLERPRAGPGSAPRSPIPRRE